MNNILEKDYPLNSNFTEESLDDNHSLKKMLRYVGSNKRVIDFGCATGYLARLLKNRGCTVTGIEINPEAAKVAEQHCERVIVADLDLVHLGEILNSQEFDVAVFGDVLEHLRDPWRVLHETQHLLKSEGYIVASIPNIAHGAVRLALLQGKFEYSKLGILDDTHLRFFTRKSVEELFEQSDYFVERVDRTKLPIFSNSPLIPNLDKDEFDIEIIQKIEQDEEAETLQFILRAFPLFQKDKYTALSQRYHQLAAELEQSHSQINLTQAEFEKSYSQLLQTQTEKEQLQTQLQYSQIELEQSHSQLQQKQTEKEQLQAQLQYSQIELEQSRSQLQQTQTDLEQSHSQLQQKQTEKEQLQAQLQHNQAEKEQLHSQLQQKQTEKEQLQAQLQYSQTKIEQLLSQLQQTQTELKRSHSLSNLTQAELEQSHLQLQQTQTELEQLQARLQHTQSEVEQLRALISDMESSKFWKLRTVWFRLKQAIGLNDSSFPPTTDLSASVTKLEVNTEEEQLQARLQHTQSEVEQLRALISGIESSKFWKLRTVWFRLKQAIGLNDSSFPPTTDSSASVTQPEVNTEKEQLQAQLQHTQSEVEQLRALISGMESSKFWKLRIAWFRLKQAMGLKDSSSPTFSSVSSSLQTTKLAATVAIPEFSDAREIKFKAVSTSSNGFFEAVNGSSLVVIEVLSAIPLAARGWAVIAEENRPADKVLITHGENNSLVAVASVALERPDVAKALKNSAYHNSGWSVLFNSSNLPRGKVALKAWAYNSARNEASQLNDTSSNSQSQILKELQPTNELLPTASSNGDPYCRWREKNFPREADLGKMAQIVKILGYKPVISVIMPVFNTRKHFLQEAIESVLNQVYPYWELCIADDASTKSDIKPLLEKYLSKDPRIKVVFRDENGHISRASNSAIEMATGEFIALLDHDDLLTPDALYEVAILLNQHSDADMIYSDEDKIDEDNQLKDPFFKPDWCPDSILSRMYTCHLGVYRRSLVTEIGGFRVGYEGSQDYDLVLRLTEKTENIFHIPKVLYHWRIHSESTASSLSSKSYTTDTAQRALLEAIHRRGELGNVIPVNGGHHIVRYKIKDFKLVSIIIPTRNLGSVLDNCLKSIFEKTTYPNYEVLIIDNGSTETETINVINEWKVREPGRFRCEALDIPFNYSKINNYAVERAKGEYLLFLNNDTEVLTPDWINAMVEQAQRPSIGAVGALLLYPDNTVQHAGVVAVGGVAGHSHKFYPFDSPGYFNQIQTVNNYSAVTAACLMCRREIFEGVGGFEEELTVSLNDVDLCLKIVEQGYRNIYLPHVVLYHYESKSRGHEDTPEKQSRFLKEVKYMQSKWKEFIRHDPCYSRNLTREREDYSIRI